VTVLNVAAEGRVQLLGDASVAPGIRHVFWSREQLGVAFDMEMVAGADRARDRLVAIGRTPRTHDLRHLGVAETFQDVQIAAHQGTLFKPFGTGGDRTALLERWTAAQVEIETFRP
jgi:hypothetical protein